MKSVRAEFKLENHFVNKDGSIITFDKEFVKIPSKKKPEDAAYDITSAVDGIIPTKGSHVFHTGVRLSVPLGWYYEIKGRSGLGFSNIVPFIGTIDATYSGYIQIKLFNLSDTDYKVHKGDRIAQLLFHEQTEMTPVEVDEFSPAYNKRGENGFGSSGV